MRFFLFVMIACAYAGCVNKERKPLMVNDRFVGNIPAAPNTAYFPDNRSDRADSIIRQWCSSILYSIHEPVLYNYSGEGESIRFVWLRPFGKPVSVRLNHFNDTAFAIIKVLEKKTAEKGDQSVIMDTLIMLDKEKWQESLTSLENNAFWNTKPADTASGAIKDCTVWFLESRVNNKYNFINRCDDGSFSSKEFNVLAKKMLELGESFVNMKGRYCIEIFPWLVKHQPVFYIYAPQTGQYR